MEISSANVKYSENFIDTVYDYQTTIVEKSSGKLIVSPECVKFVTVIDLCRKVFTFRR